MLLCTCKCHTQIMHLWVSCQETSHKFHLEALQALNSLDLPLYHTGACEDLVQQLQGRKPDIRSLLRACSTTSSERGPDKVQMYKEMMMNDDNLESNLLTSILLKIHSLVQIL